MGTRIHIMDIDIDLLTEETLQSNINEYLSNGYLNVAHVIPVDYVTGAIENETIKEALADADLVLPGERAVFSNHHVDILEKGGMVVNYTAIAQVMSQVDLTGKKSYFYMRTKEEAKDMYRLVRALNIDCESVGVYAADGNMSREALINDINTQVPDIIYLSLDKGEQEQWILENKSSLNAKLCVCLGGIVPMIRRENPEIPKVFAWLHLSGLYRMIRRIPNSHLLRSRIFRRKMADYNNQKNS